MPLIRADWSRLSTVWPTFIESAIVKVVHPFESRMLVAYSESSEPLTSVASVAFCSKPDVGPRVKRSQSLCCVRTVWKVTTRSGAMPTPISLTGRRERDVRRSLMKKRASDATGRAVETLYLLNRAAVGVSRSAISFRADMAVFVE
jgi:hypothetical protein